MVRTSQPGDIERRLIGVTEQIVGKVQLRALQALTSATPVDTGFARAGWTPSVGSPVAARLTPPSDDSESRSLSRSRFAENTARAKQIAAFYRITMGPAFIVNSVPYLKYLNQGSSAQAGAKFVERALETTVRSFGGRRL